MQPFDWRKIIVGGDVESVPNSFGGYGNNCLFFSCEMIGESAPRIASAGGHIINGEAIHTTLLSEVKSRLRERESCCASLRFT